jgi:hypothetical protein
MAAPTVLYMAGYGRSGSTLLDTMLGNVPGVFGGGEITSLFEEVRDNGTCTCGERYRDCEVWGHVLDALRREVEWFGLGEASRLTRKLEVVQGSRIETDRYSRIWNTVFRTLGDVVPADLVVDSSKSTWGSWRRGQLLGGPAGLDVRILHLVRDPRGVMWSIRRGSNRRLLAGKPAKVKGGVARGLAGWMHAQLIAEGYSEFGAAPFLRVRYEDLATDPDSVLGEIGAFLGMEMRDGVTSTGKTFGFGIGHGVSGNRMRRGGPVQIRFDEEWRRKLPLLARLLANVSYPLMKKYGYTDRGGGSQFTARSRCHEQERI